MIWMLRAIIVLSATAAQSQTVSIRSGEHDRFSRLVLSIPDGTDWQLFQTGEGYQLRLGNDDLSFDDREIFDRIPRSRLSNVSPQGNQLDMSIACTCHLDAFLFQPEMLVLDIIDGPSPTGESYSFPPEFLATDSGVERGIVIDTSTPNLEIRATPQPDRLTPPELEVRLLERRLTNEDNLGYPNENPVSVELPLFTPPRSASDPLANFSPQFALQEQRDPNLAEAERAILESFARAATQGIFDFPARPLSPLVGKGEEAPLTLVAPMTDPMDGVTIPLAATDPEGPGFLLRTGIDRAAISGEVESEPDSCPQGINFDLTTWGEPGGYAELIPRLRLETIDEAGQQQSDAVLLLAEALIFYGFGLEALRSLETVLEPSERATFLAIIANLVDGNSVDVSDLLPYRACGESMEAWIALATGRLDSSDQSIISAILMAARALPDSLRGHLGIRLAQIFARAGELHNAQEVLEASSRAITGNGPETERAAAGLAGLVNGPEAEAEQLGEFVQTNARAAPEDMIRLMELARQQEATLNSAVLEIAETMRFEANGSEATRNLVEAEVLLLLEQDAFQDALNLLAGDVGPMTDQQLAGLRGEAMVVLAEAASDDVFLSFAFSDAIKSTTISSKHAFADRLIELGFPAQAYSMIQDPITGAFYEERLALQTRALTAIQGLDENRGRASEPTQADTEEALDGTPSQTQLDTAWRNGAWEDLQDSDDPLLSSASRAILTPSIPPSAETPLTDIRDLLGQAQEARDLADGLLRRFALDVDGSTSSN